jgi:uncharacterized membrane protein
VSRSVVFRLSLATLIALYPFIVFLGIDVLPPGGIGLILALLLLVRFGFVRPGERVATLPVGVILVAYAVGTALTGSTLLLLFYPVVVNAIFLVLFAASLLDDEPLLLRIIRARGTVVSPIGVIYLRRLTAIWAGFFLINGAIAAWTTTADLRVWTLYNGLISYLVVAALILGELLFRRHYKKRHNISDE